MGEICLRVIRDERFELLPAAVVIADAFTAGANPQQTAKIGQLPLTGFVRGPLRFNALGYVDAASDVTQKFTVVSEKRHATVENPTIGSVMPFQPVLHFENFTFGEGFQVRVQAALQIVGVNAFGPLVPDLLFHSAAAEV